MKLGGSENLDILQWTWTLKRWLVYRKRHPMALQGLSMMASTQSSLVVPKITTCTDMSPTPTNVGTNLGFIISLCMVEQCLKYADENIKSVYIYDNCNITKIPANAFLGATYLEVSKPCAKMSYMYISMEPWWRHQMETSSALLSLCAGNSPVTGEFPSQRLVTRSFDVFFDMCLNKRLSKQPRRRWFETPSRSIWRHCIGSLLQRSSYCSHLSWGTFH